MADVKEENRGLKGGLQTAAYINGWSSFPNSIQRRWNAGLWEENKAPKNLKRCVICVDTVFFHSNIDSGQSFIRVIPSCSVTSSGPEMAPKTLHYSHNGFRNSDDHVPSSSA